jgi:hypothetical protein
VKLRPDWRKLPKMWSAQVKAVGASVAGGWIAMPDWLRAKLPGVTEKTVIYAAAALFILGIVAQAFGQALEDEQGAQDGENS